MASAVAEAQFAQESSPTRHLQRATQISDGYGNGLGYQIYLCEC